ncbi:bifunctional diguanylate cyclase/phosphodiesterase [Shewanella sp. KJ2020]|uniref:putative bifunctional diguanylate cyclase/phosphodiesterase n=1 Tax=Shewanella sp. KJ2020 TaxID=2919172 RepID=UPI0020A8089C|nr:EAL domain-containing protein [Shewanella sp. KJ2020]MCP3128278.1 EAL domain-containing protein [Shewanella sp. KJ2020]
MSDGLTNSLQQALVTIFSETPLETLEQNVDRALETITLQLHCDGVFVLTGSQSLDHLRTRNLYLKPQFTQGQQTRVWPLARMPFFRSLVRSPRLLNLPDVNTLPADAQAERALLRDWNVKSLLVLPPVVFGETRIALGAVNCSECCEWSDEFIHEFNHAAVMIGSAMELTRIAHDMLASEHKYREVFNQLPLACALLDKHNQLAMLNKVAQQTLPVQHGYDLFCMVREEEHAMLTDTLHMVREGVLGQAWCELLLKSVHQLDWLRLSFSQIHGDRDTLVMIAEDVSEKYRLADELSFHANYDALTGLPNRLHFEALLDNLLQTRDDMPTCVAFVDVDQFQVINNISGHQAGDKLLCQLALRLKQLVRKGDIVARLGGDEFGILMHYCNVDSAQHIATRICTQLASHEFVWENRCHNVSVSMGIAKFDKSATDIYTVMSQADAACRLAKDQGRNGWHLYSAKDPKMTRLYTEMMASVDIVSALALNQFELYFQTIVPLNRVESGLHLEILLRMVQSNGTIVSPAIFLPAAERYNLASKVDLWVIDNLLKWGSCHLALWQQLDLVSVNLSATSLGDREFMNWLEMRLMTEPELVDKLCIEITETAAVSQLDQATKLIEVLRPLKCKLALDDFGAGFSSFAYLKRLNVDFVKVDGQFVINICDDPADQAIVKAICQLGQDMGFDVIAEFVESQEIGLKLQALGVDYAQGYAINKPMRLSELRSGLSQPWLQTHDTLAAYINL